MLVNLLLQCSYWIKKKYYFLVVLCEDNWSYYVCEYTSQLDYSFSSGVYVGNNELHTRVNSARGSKFVF